MIAAFKPAQAELARQAASSSRLPVDVYVRKTRESIHAASCCMAVSGSVSLELLYHAKPTVILYWINPFASGCSSSPQGEVHYAGQPVAHRRAVSR